MATAAGTMQRPARTGDRPAASWKYCVMKSIIAPVSMVLRVKPLIAAVNVRFASSRRSSSGSGRRRCRRTNATSSAAPAATAATYPACQPARARPVMP